MNINPAGKEFCDVCECDKEKNCNIIIEKNGVFWDTFYVTWDFYLHAVHLNTLINIHLGHAIWYLPQERGCDFCNSSNFWVNVNFKRVRPHVSYWLGDCVMWCAAMVNEEIWSNTNK